MLRRETRALHEDVERRVDLMNRVGTPSDYRTLLEKFYGVYRPMEAQIQRADGEISRWLPDIGDRRRTALLESDLHVLGNKCPDALTLAPIQAFRSLGDYLGCLYVLEGSTLGGQIITRYIRERLPYTSRHGCAFFSSYGAETARRWRIFLEAIESYSTIHPEEHRNMVASAACTYGTFADWIA